MCNTFLKYLLTCMRTNTVLTLEHPTCSEGKISQLKFYIDLKRVIFIEKEILFNYKYTYTSLSPFSDFLSIQINCYT